MPRVLRPSIRQVVEDRLAFGSAARLLEQVGQIVSRLGAEGAGRRVVSHRLLARRRAQLVEGPGQGITDPNVAGMAAGRGSEQGHGGLGLADGRQGLAQQHGRGGRQLGRLAGSRQGRERLGPRLAVFGQEDRAQAVAIWVRVGQPRRLQRLPPGGHGAIRRAAYGRPVVQEGRNLDHGRLGLAPQPTGELGRLEGVEIQPRVAEGGRIRGISALEADILLIGPDLNQLLPQPDPTLGLFQASLDLAAQDLDLWPLALGPLQRRQSIAPRARIASLSAGPVA